MCYQAKFWQPKSWLTGLLSLGAALIVSISPQAQASGTVMKVDTDPASGVSMELESWLESSPPIGMLPVEWRVVNRSTSEHTWELVTQSQRSYSSTEVMTGRYYMTVAPQSSGTMTVYVPVSFNSHYYGYQSIEWRVIGFGARRGGSFPSSGTSGSNTEYIALGKEAAGNAGWKSLQNEVSKSSSSLYGCEVDMKKTPADWRGYSGVGQLWVSDREWLGMAEMSRVAVLDWLSMGGKVFVLTQDTEARDLAGLKLKEGTNSESSYGAGLVTRLSWDGSNLPVAAMQKLVTRTGSSLHEVRNNYGTGWELYKKIGSLKINAPLIFGFILVFGILVGPVNLFVFAKTGKRSRLFWTTPLISIGGSLILIVLMIVQDGFGGRGSRQVLAVLQPEQKRLSIIQEQVSLTGILSNRGFERKDQDMMIPLEIEDRSNLSAKSFTETAGTRYGSWFNSRAIQAHVLQTVRPSRAGIEFYPAKDADSAPEVISTLEVPLQTLYVRDSEGVIWKAETVGTGERKALTKADDAALEKWKVDNISDQSGAVMNMALDRVMEQRGYVFGISSAAAPLAVSTLDSINWNDERLVVVGPYVTP